MGRDWENDHYDPPVSPSPAPAGPEPCPHGHPERGLTCGSECVPIDWESRCRQAEQENVALREAVQAANSMAVDIRTICWDAIDGIRGEDRTLVGMVRLLANKLDEARDNRRGEYELRCQAEASLATVTAERDEARKVSIREAEGCRQALARVREAISIERWKLCAIANRYEQERMRLADDQFNAPTIADYEARCEVARACVKGLDETLARAALTPATPPAPETERQP